MASFKQLQDNPLLGPFVKTLVDRLGVGGARKIIQQGATMTTGPVDKIPVPRPQFGPGARPKSAPTSSNVPLQRSPIGTEGRTRPAPKRAEFTPVEAIEVEGQLRIPLTQPGQGGRIYSPAKSSKSADVVEASMRSNLGDVMDAAGFPRYKAAEGQFGMDLEPDVTREMMRRMAPSMSQAPSIPASMRPMGVQVTDLRGIDPKLIERGIGLGIIGAGVLGKEELVNAPARFEQELAAENKLISDVLASASQQGGALAEVIMRNAPRGPENYSSREEYNRVRSEFLDNLRSGRFQQAADLIEQYRAQQKAPQSQQTGEAVTTERLVAEAGSDDAANVAGNITYGAESDMAGPPAGAILDGTAERQGASELSQFTQTRSQPELRMASTAMMQSIKEDAERRLAAEADPRNQAYIAARAGLGPNATQAQMDQVRDMGLELFRQNFPQMR